LVNLCDKRIIHEGEQNKRLTVSVGGHTCAAGYGWRYRGQWLCRSSIHLQAPSYKKLCAIADLSEIRPMLPATSSFFRSRRETPQLSCECLTAEDMVQVPRRGSRLQIIARFGTHRGVDNAGELTMGSLLLAFVRRGGGLVPLSTRLALLVCGGGINRDASPISSTQF